MPASLRLQYSFAVGVFFFFAAALQAQISLFPAENYEGLRVSLADLCLPLTVILIAVSLLLKKSHWPRFEKPFGYGWIGALSAMMGFALWNGPGGDWALINKFTGWFILMAYLGVGAWIAANYNDLTEKFLKIFSGVFLVSLIALPVLAVFKIFPTPYSGLMGNPNAYGFLLCSAGSFITLPALKDHKKNIPLLLFWALLPCALVFSGSRALWLVLALLLIVFTVMNWRIVLRRILPALVVGALLAATLNQFSDKQFIALRPLNAMKGLYDYVAAPEQPEIAEKAAMRGDDRRIGNIRLSIELWKENPVAGAGLGASHKAQIKHFGELRAVVDNTLLWIAAEMGSIGVILFLAAYIAMICALWRRTKEASGYGLAACALAVLLIFGIYSLFHEVLYTRFMWFILGLALARRQG